MMVGGDWYDAFPLPDGRIGVCVGDVSGHGLEAAVLMASMRNALRTALIMEPNIARALETIDFLMRTEAAGSQFCTAALGIIDLESMTIRLSSAGHPGPKIWDTVSGLVTDPFTKRDLPLGLHDIESSREPPHSVRINSGIAVFYTDGLIECRRNPVEGDKELERAMSRRDVRESPDPARAIVDTVLGKDEPQDDVAVLVAIFDGSP